MTDDEHPAVVVVVEVLEGVRPCVGGVVEGFVCERSVQLTNIVSTINQHCQYNQPTLSVPLTNKDQYH